MLAGKAGVRRSACSIESRTSDLSIMGVVDVEKTIKLRRTTNTIDLPFGRNPF
jgi:hypothetical protein